MGMYTQFHFGSNLKKDTPREVIEILQYMASGEDKPEELPNDEFFKCERWWVLFRMDSEYFKYKTHCSFENKHGRWNLSVTSNLKDYDDEIEKFVRWVSPYLDASNNDYLGYSRYEEGEIPINIYHKNN